MQNDRGATSGAPYYGQELIYSRNILGAANQYSKWEVSSNLYYDSTHGIKANGITQSGDYFAAGAVFGIRLTGALWFDPVGSGSKLACSVVQGLTHSQAYQPVRCQMYSFTAP